MTGTQTLEPASTLNAFTSSLADRLADHPRKALSSNVGGPYAEGDDPGRKAAHGPQPQEHSDGREERRRPARPQGRVDHTPLGEGLESLYRAGRQLAPQPHPPEAGRPPPPGRRAPGE